MSRTCPECSNQYEDEVEVCPQDSFDLSAVELDDELLGRSIGSYQIIKPLGKGGMGAVYLAQHPVIGSKVAIKFLHPQYATDKKIVDRFFNEARAVNVIGHDNILKILDLNVTEDNRHYFIMEFLYGRALQKLVEEGLPNSLEVTGPIMLQFCEALQAAHDHQIYHRDIKPDNVYLIVHKGKKNFVKVVDFGIAKLTDGSGQSTGQTQTGMVMGTPAYMSPEQAGGMTSKIGATSDIYSAGAMLFQMATGKLPFPGSSFGEVLIGHLQLPPPNPHDINPEIQPELEAVILKALSKKQEDRQQSMKEMHDEIKAVMDKYGITAELPAADEEDIKKAASANQVISAVKSATKVGGMTRSPSRPGNSQPGQGRSQPPQEQAATQYMTPAAPAKSSVGLFIGIGAAALLLVGGGVGFAVWQSGQNAAAAERIAHESAARAAAAAAEAVAEANKKAAAANAPVDAPVFLSIVSDPPGAKVEATWTGGQRMGEAPMDFSVPKNMKVRFQFSKPGFLPYSADVIADTAQVVKAALVAEQKVAVAKVGGGDASASAEKRKKKEKKTTTEMPKDGDDDIKVDF